MAREPDLVEPDRMVGVRHPREQRALYGHGAAEQTLVDAINAGRLHHAWLIGGPQGIGKATLAYRVARHLLARGAAPARTLDVPADHPAARQIAALSHPNLAVLRRAPGLDGKLAAASISVDAVRKGLALFGSTAADSGHRVCIVDSAEDLTVASANALLKLVEEPPRNALFLIVSHAPQRVLPTIRSRCRRLLLRPLAEPDIRAVLRSLGEPFSTADGPLLDAALPLGEGSVRRTIEMLDADKIALVGEVDALLAALPRFDLKRVLALGETLAKRGADDAYELALDTVFRWVSRRLEAEATLGPARLAPLVEVCEKVGEAARAVDTYNLDRRPLVLALFGDLANAVGRAG